MVILGKVSEKNTDLNFNTIKLELKVYIWLLHNQMKYEFKLQCCSLETLKRATLKEYFLELLSNLWLVSQELYKICTLHCNNWLTDNNIILVYNPFKIIHVYIYFILTPVIFYIKRLFHPYRPVWYVPDQSLDYTILDT